MCDSHGFSQERLDPMHDIMSGHVARGAAPGVVTVLSRHGEVGVDAIGRKAIDSDEPMRRDTIFRITSMTKPITAVAAMILVEESKLRLDEPVDDLLPRTLSSRSRVAGGVVVISRRASPSARASANNTGRFASETPCFRHARHDGTLRPPRAEGVAPRHSQ